MHLLLRLRGLSSRDARARARRWIDRMELGPLANRRISQLSKGQQQKAQVALAVAHDPDLLILDEPFSGLDPHHQRLIATVFREAADRGATVILSTHRLREAEALVDQVVMMSHGRKVLEGPLQDLRMAYHSTRYRLVVRGEAQWIDGDEVVDWTPSADGHLVTLRDGATSHALLGRAIAHEANIVHFEQILPSLPELFEAHTVATASQGGLA